MLLIWRGKGAFVILIVVVACLLVKGETSTPQPVEKGYYVHVWKRIEPGEWKVVLDVTTALPADSGSSNQ